VWGAGGEVRSSYPGRAMLRRVRWERLGDMHIHK
jgi:hypothetical protein